MAGGAGGGGDKGREGDWECGSCQNRNYAFRSLCNRCKQPRILVDTNKNTHDAKWLPRIGDWICSGCSNNNYASREKCKKCGRPKEEVALPAIAMHGASLPTYAHYFARAQAQGLLGLRMNYGMSNAAGLQQGLSPYTNCNWPYGVAERYGLQSGSSWPIGGSSSLLSYGGGGNSLMTVPKDWRSGDWMCDCGFHNYASRSQCKKCNSPMPSGGTSVAASTASDLFPALGTKRLASEEFGKGWDNKRLNAGDYSNHFLASRQRNPYDTLEQLTGASDDQFPGINSNYPGRNPAAQMQSPQQLLLPSLPGKGAKQWREGDWMCSNCNNHNYASRSQCNRCKMDKEASLNDANKHPAGAV